MKKFVRLIARNFPEYRVAVFLNQLKATDHNSNEDGMEEVELVSYSQLQCLM